MALILTAAAAYAAYAAAKQGEGESGDRVAEFDDSFDLTGKVEVTLLPLEVTLDVMEAPISTITFMEGNYLEAAKFIQKRVAEIIYRNPFLGGWLVKKPREKYPKLVFDPSSDDVCAGIIKVLEPGEVNLSYPETPYEDYGKVVGNHGKVPLTVSLINRSEEPMFRVAVIPDALHLSDKFALVVSMCHQCGDPYTFYRVHDMLVSSKIAVEALNPHRKHSFSEALFNRMGREEAFYVRNALSNSLWEWNSKKTEAKPVRRKLFYISNEWLAREREATKQDDAGGLLEPSTASVLSSWFFNAVQPTVGFIPINFRNRLLPQCNVGDSDAGTYQNTIPFTNADYATPFLIEKSISSAKRCAGAADEELAPLPRIQQGATYSVVTDWSSFTASSEEFLAADNGDFRPLLHMPLYDSQDLKVIPEKLSFLNIFTASPDDDSERTVKIAAFVMAPEAVVAEIESCGIAEEVIFDFPDSGVVAQE